MWTKTKVRQNNLGQKSLSDHMKVDFGAAHGWQYIFMVLEEHKHRNQQNWNIGGGGGLLRKTTCIDLQEILQLQKTLLLCNYYTAVTKPPIENHFLCSAQDETKYC